MLVFLFALMIAPVKNVKADDTVSVKNGFKQTVVYSKTDKKWGYNYCVTSVPDNAKKCKVTSSKKSVGTVENYGYGVFNFMPKKEGKTTITITGVVNGKTKKWKGTIRVVKFQQPFKVLKINGKSYLKKIKGSNNYCEMKTGKDKIRIDYKLQPGWKVVESYVNDEKVKSGKTYSKDENGSMVIYMTLKNRKRGEKIFFYFSECPR